ncbi:glycoside hydrolase family 115 protein [Melanomma pulvis-pyrius CBS 109.77]|uniref:Glycoside hydrolase family 115 protein n=1 Tax=Melanomma pulvis-pyrius CBS 109.77 TaxID=1314802 RepID=A0A6A6WUE9_9PLEO|nr:glycoside hydrolase family 115 protein [Melanomma pulvis-pyrius CBS 109.77]
MPGVTTIPTTAPSTGLLGVSVQNSAASTPGDAAPPLLALDPYTPENRTIDVYIRGSGTVSFTITPSQPHVRVSPTQGTLSYPSGTSDIRAVLSVDWAAAPTGASTVDITIKPATGTAVTLSLPLNNVRVAENYTGYVASNGVVAMEMSRFTSRTPGSGGATVELIPNYGRTGEGLTLMPVTAGTQTVATAPKAVYSFYALTAPSANAKLSVYLPPSFNVAPSTPLRLAVALDNATPTTITPVPSSTLGAMPGGWSESVVSGARVVSADLGKVGAGKHELSVWLLEPGTVVHRLVVDLGGVKSSHLGPWESGWVG